MRVRSGYDSTLAIILDNIIKTRRYLYTDFDIISRLKYARDIVHW